MKLLYVYDSLAIWGGIERVLTAKMNYLCQVYGYDISMLTINQGDHKKPYQLDSRIHFDDLRLFSHHQYKYKGLQRYWKRFILTRKTNRLIAKHVAQINPDVTITTVNGLIGSLNKALAGKPLVVESHSGYWHVVEYQHMSWVKRLQSGQIYHQVKHSNALVALTEADAQQWRRIHRSVTVIPNVVFLNKTGPYSNHQQKRAIFVGRLVHQKGLPELLSVWKRINEQYQDWQLNIYGEGELLTWLQQEVKNTGANITINAPVSNIFACYAQSSLLVLTSVYEPFGLVMPEAMSCGLPVVAFDCPYGPAEIVTDGKDGFLVKDRNVEVFAQRVCQLIENEELRRSMGQAAIQSAQRYSAEVIMPQWKDFFEGLLK